MKLAVNNSQPKIPNKISVYLIPGLSGMTSYLKQNDEKYILKITARHFNLKLNEIKSKSRKEDYRLPRQIAMYLYINYTSFSMAKIGWICGNKDHATVLNARKAVSSMRLTNHKNINYHIDKLNELLAA